MKLWSSAAIAAMISALAGTAMAQDEATNLAHVDDAPRSVAYLGVGQALTDDEFESDATPFSLGIMGQSEAGSMIFGFDVALEGTMIDSTYGRDGSPSQAMSFNALVGANLFTVDDWRLDAALLLGMRESAQDCPDSFVGYRCYADLDPEVEYAFNYGAVVAASYDRFMLGVRGTTESAQVISGFRF